MTAPEKSFIGPKTVKNLARLIDESKGRSSGFEGGGGGGGLLQWGQPFFLAGRLGKISATWNKGATATVVALNPDGTIMFPTVEFEAINHFATITVPDGEERKVLCLFTPPLWLLCSAECA